MKSCSVRMPIAQVVICLLFVMLVSVGLEEFHGRDVRRRLSSQGMETIHVCEGDTMWDWAKRRPAEGVSTYELVSWMREENGLDSSCLTPGQELLVPATEKRTGF